MPSIVESRIEGEFPNFVAMCSVGTSRAYRCGFQTKQAAQEWLNVMIPKIKFYSTATPIRDIPDLPKRTTGEQNHQNTLEQAINE